MEFRPRLRWRAYSAPQNQLVGFKEPILPRGRGEEVGTEGKGRGRDGNARWGGKGKEKDTIREGEGGEKRGNWERKGCSTQTTASSFY